MPSIYAYLSPSTSLSIDPHLSLPLWCNETQRSPLRIAAHRQSLTAFTQHEHSHTHPLNPTAPHLDPLVSWRPCFSLSPNIRQQFAPTHLSIHLQLLNLVSFLANHFKSMLGSRKPVNLCKSCGYSGAVQLVATQPQTRIHKPKLTPNNA